MSQTSREIIETRNKRTKVRKVYWDISKLSLIEREAVSRLQMTVLGVLAIVSVRYWRELSVVNGCCFHSDTPVLLDSRTSVAVMVHMREDSLYFDQLIDHNYANKGTFEQRYWQTAEFYEDGGCLILWLLLKAMQMVLVFFLAVVGNPT